MKFLLAREKDIRGVHTTEDEATLDFFVDQVLPRYLRPLETGGRSIKPTLCHTDLRPGNVKYKPDGDRIIVYVANALWAHNEVQFRTVLLRLRDWNLGLFVADIDTHTLAVERAPFRNPRYKLGKAYLQEYRRHIGWTRHKIIERPL